MKTLLFNASPRKNENTFKLLSSAMEGAKNAGSDVSLFHLYDYMFQGCVSCFACKKKGNTCNGLCIQEDAIRPVLEEAQTADCMIFGSPVYLHGATAQFRAFLERLLFPVTTYSVDENGKRVRFLKKTTPTGLIYSMNNGEELMDVKQYPTLLGINGSLLENIYGHNEILYVHNTWQFDSYDKYDANLFDLERKKHDLLHQFPQDLEKAYRMGERLVRIAGGNDQS